MSRPVQNITILGGGSAGFMCALALKSRLPHTQITVIRSKEIGIIGVGEGSTLALTRFLHQYLRVDTAEFFKIAKPTFKLGLKFLWGPRPYFNYTFGPGLEMRYEDLSQPNGFFCRDSVEYTDLISALMTHDRAFEPAPAGLQFHEALSYHVENTNFVEYLETCATKLGVTILEDTVENVDQNEAGVAALHLQSGQQATADLYIDCSGYASVLLNKTLNEPYVSFKPSLFCDRAVVGGWARRPDEIIKPYTTCETMKTGWCWQIEHENRINRGYVYSSDFIDDSAAEAEFRAQNPAVDRTRIVKFISGRYARSWVKNVIAIGNAAGFVEPLEATALGVIGTQSAMLAETLLSSAGSPTEWDQKLFNDHHARTWDAIRGFIALHYKFNTRLDTPFWRACQSDTDLATAGPVVDYYTQNGPRAMWQASIMDEYDQFKLAGYWTLLVGMNVPHQNPFTPTTAQLNLFNNKRAHFQERAMRALTVRQSLDLIHSPSWQWS